MQTKAIGKEIAKLRKGKSLTQKELAEALHVSASAVSKWENDMAMPDESISGMIFMKAGSTVDGTGCVPATNNYSQDMVRRKRDRLTAVSTGSPWTGI